MKTKAIYAGSFDPITNGHLWVIDKALHLFDEVTIAVANNPSKKCKFTFEQRVELMKKSVYDEIGLTSFNVVTIENDFLVTFAKEHDIKYMIRGIRSSEDYEYERGMRNANYDIDPDIETVYLIPPRHLCEVSSSFVKGLIGFKGWEGVVKKYVPRYVYNELTGTEKHDLSVSDIDIFWNLREYDIHKLDERTVQMCYENIKKRYSEDHRYYHTMEHIKECFKWLIEVDEFTDVDYDLIKMAIIFHDCYYTVMPRKEGDASNEIISATISRDWMKKFLLPEQFIKKVEFLIESTEKHLPITTDDKSIETDCKIFLDIDLSILGADPKRYDHYAHQIREEYSFVHDGAYNPARTKILQGFLDRKEIYFTNFFIERLESQARDNIEREIANLKK